MIQVENLTKEFGKGDQLRTVVDHTNWQAEDGQITGFIGHNGAGKTTTLKMITGMMRPTKGKVLLNGISIEKKAKEAKKQFGFVSDSPDHFLRLKGIEYLNFMADIYGVGAHARKTFIEEYAERFSMADALDRTILSYSHGMRQKIMIMGALIHQPSIWILDEPLYGLDPESAYELKLMMKEHVRKGNSVLFSTHVLEVAEKLCDRIVIIRQGKILYQGTLADLRSRYSREMTLEEIFLEMNQNPDHIPEPRAETEYEWEFVDTKKSEDENNAGPADRTSIQTSFGRKVLSGIGKRRPGAFLQLGQKDGRDTKEEKE